MSWWKKLLGANRPELFGEEGAFRKLDGLEIPSILDVEVYEPSVADAEQMLDPWFDTPDWREAGHRFLAFAQDGTGGTWMLWQYAGLQGRPPVIFLGSEGERGVVCDHLDEWIGCLGSGLWWDSHGDQWEAPPADEYPFEDEDRARLAAFPEVIRGRGAVPVSDPAAQTARARARHPDLGAWVDEVVNANATPFQQALTVSFTDPAAALAIVEPALEAQDGWRPTPYESRQVGVWALGSGQPEKALKWSTDAGVRGRALIALGRPAEAAEALGDPYDLEERYLKATALEAAGRDDEARAVRDAADRTAYEHAVGPTKGDLADRADMLARREARLPPEQAAVVPWLRIERARVAAERGLHDEAAELIAGVEEPVPPWVEEVLAAVKAALDTEAGPLELARANLETARANQSEDDVAHARGRLGLLLEQEDPAEAWSHLEAAVMALPGSSALSKDAFAALDRLEQAGHAPE